MTKVKKDNDNLVKELDVDKSEIVSEIKEEVMSNLEEEILEIIENETRDKLDSMERRIYKFKNRTIRKRNTVILILIVIVGFETKLLLNDFSIRDYLELSNNSNTNEEVSGVIKDLDWYKDNYGYLFDNINTNLDSDNFNYLYKDNYRVSDIDNKVKLNMAYSLLDSKDINNSNSVISVSNDSLRNSYNKIFNDNGYKEDNFSYGCISFIYNKSNDSYMAIDVECVNSKSIKEEIINIYEEDNNIVIETIAGIYDSSNNSLSNIDGNIVSDDYNGKLDSYRDKLDKYKYTFIKDGNSYYFSSIDGV